MNGAKNVRNIETVTCIKSLQWLKDFDGEKPDGFGKYYTSWTLWTEPIQSKSDI